MTEPNKNPSIFKTSPHPISVRAVDRRYVGVGFDYICFYCRTFVKHGRDIYGDVCWSHEDKSLNDESVKT